MMRLARPLLAAVLLVGISNVAAGHGVREASIPEAGAVIATAPEQLVVRFDQPHRVTLLQLATPGGDVARLTADQGMAPSREITAAPTEMTEPGVYRLMWRALAEDGHVVEDAITFTYAPAD